MGVMPLTYYAQRTALWMLIHHGEDIEVPDRVCPENVLPAVFEELDLNGYGEHVKVMGGPPSLVFSSAGRGRITQDQQMIRANIVERLLLQRIAANDDMPFEAIPFIHTTAVEFSGQADESEVHAAAANLRDYGLITDVQVSEATGPVRPSLTLAGRRALRSPFAPTEIPPGSTVGNTYNQSVQISGDGIASQGDRNTITQQNQRTDLAGFEAAIEHIRELVQREQPATAPVLGAQLDAITETARGGAGRDMVRAGLTAVVSALTGGVAAQALPLVEQAVQHLI